MGPSEEDNEATTDYHPSVYCTSGTESRPRNQKTNDLIPSDKASVSIKFGNRELGLTNLLKKFWPLLGITKGDLLRYYLSVSKQLLPHLADRAMVMKRYPNGIDGDFFFMKRAPSHRPDWIDVCAIKHSSGNVIDFPIVGDVPSLLWVINLGCIDLNQWYARCDDVDRPDYLHFDLDPVGQTDFQNVIEGALLIRESLEALGMRPFAKTSGSRGLHIYVPIVRGPLQHQVWSFAKELSRAAAAQRPNLLTAEYKKNRRPVGRVLVDYNQNAWGRTLASIYSVRPTAVASVSTPVTWEELERGVKTEDFRIDNVAHRISKLGDLWKPMLLKTGRFRLEQYL
ncbi:MAG TPA: non-homologous end-joining DNA ligase [Blastocatellia bacterium]